MAKQKTTKEITMAKQKTTEAAAPEAAATQDDPLAAGKDPTLGEIMAEEARRAAAQS